MNDAEELLRAALLKVPAGLAEHVVRVVDEALRLADVHGIDKQSVRIAALGHDLLRALNNERLLGIADDQAYAATDADRMEPILMHGPLAVALLREQYNVVDADILGAVAYHTTAHAGMTPLQKLIFIADKIEPMKRARNDAHGSRRRAGGDGPRRSDARPPQLHGRTGGGSRMAAPPQHRRRTQRTAGASAGARC